MREKMVRFQPHRSVKDRRPTSTGTNRQWQFEHDIGVICTAGVLLLPFLAPFFLPPFFFPIGANKHKHKQACF
jgi:hypothetical protein